MSGISVSSQLAKGQISKWRNQTQRRYQLQQAATRLLPSHRICVCNRWLKGKDSREVVVKYSPTEGKAAYQGLMQCASVWVCPVCSAKVSERKRQELKAARLQWEALGNVVVHVTYTVQHDKKDSFEKTLADLDAVRKSTWSGAWAKEIKQNYRIRGRCRSLEVTYGANGFHPHHHELLFIEGSVNVEHLESDLRHRWAHYARSRGNPVKTEIGVVIQSSSEYIAEYISKIGRDPSWSCDEEMTKQASKIGRAGGRTPFALLADYLDNGDDHAGRIFALMATVLKGKPQIYWTAETRKLLGLGREKSDVEIADEQGAEYIELCRIKLADWLKIVESNLQGYILALASGGSADEVETFIGGLGSVRSHVGALPMKVDRKWMSLRPMYISSRLRDAIDILDPIET